MNILSALRDFGRDSSHGVFPSHSNLQTFKPSNLQTFKPSNLQTFKLHPGQAALEYVLVLSALLVVVATTGYLIHATRHASVRTVNLVGSDCP